MSAVERHSSEIKRDLMRRRSELEEQLTRLFRGRKARSSAFLEPGGPIGVAPVRNGAGVPLLPIAAGVALVGVFLMRRHLSPLRLAGRFVELAAPVVVPALVRRLAGGRDQRTGAGSLPSSRRAEE